VGSGLVVDDGVLLQLFSGYTILGSRSAGSVVDTCTVTGAGAGAGAGAGDGVGAAGATGFICSTINFLRSSNCFITSAVDTCGGGGSCAAFAAKHASHLQPSGRVGVGILGLIGMDPLWVPNEPGFLTKLDD
jgi:hypothetical protein